MGTAPCSSCNRCQSVWGTWTGACHFCIVWTLTSKVHHHPRTSSDPRGQSQEIWHVHAATKAYSWFTWGSAATISCLVFDVFGSHMFTCCVWPIKFQRPSGGHCHKPPAGRGILHQHHSARARVQASSPFLQEIPAGNPRKLWKRSNLRWHPGTGSLMLEFVIRQLPCVWKSHHPIEISLEQRSSRRQNRNSMGWGCVWEVSGCLDDKLHDKAETFHQYRV